ncbi:MAG: RNHCP domain-containing protein [Planctomycetota bacterium]|nr:RNHCP domain-containing protein [Planctomycetota bacterium]
MSRKSRPDSKGFTCIHCRTPVPGTSYGTKHRNHCPGCLWSRHVDDEIGDRRSPCTQPMEPIGVAIRDDGEWTLIHKCLGCGMLRTNRIAGDDRELSLLSLALRPLAQAPFPIDDLR